MKNYEKFGIVDKTVYYFCNIITIFIALLLFLYLNQLQPTYYTDEVFHIPQTIKYCKGIYHEWNPKITTLPILYLITSQLLKPFELCNTIWIRSTSLVFTFINLYLITCIIKHLHNINENTPKKKQWVQIISAYNIAFLPPLFFWFFLYYTDIFSVTMVLSMLLLHIRGYFTLAGVSGAISVLVRQTNIIWIFLLAAEYCLDKIEMKSKHEFRMLHYDNTMFNCTKKIWNYFILQIRRGPIAFGKFILDLVLDIWMYVLCGILFLIFIVWNEGIVVGDHNSHQPTIHLTQIFYFSMFSFLFAWPYMIKWLRHFFIDITKHWVVSSFLFVLIVIIIHNNTLVHQYVLADNRHYVFYFWNKFMNRYTFFKYFLAPFYGFFMYSFYQCINYVKFSKKIVYFFCLFIVLIPQLLLEPRYFILPYILFRLNLRFPEMWQIILESITILICNFGQFYLFANKTFYWKDLKEPQRIGW